MLVVKVPNVWAERDVMSIRISDENVEAIIDPAGSNVLFNAVCTSVLTRPAIEFVDVAPLGNDALK